MKIKLIVGIAILWLAVVSLGTYGLMRYANTPGAEAQAPADWPKDSTLMPAHDKPTLVLFGHPECPCTKATIGELNNIIAKVQGRIRTYVLFVIPKDETEEWQDGALEQEAKSIPEVRTLTDVDGIEASRFNAKTSGQVMLYDEHGHLQFSGGITSARGHFGDNVGKSAVVSFVNHKEVIARTTKVFGCALYSIKERKDTHEVGHRHSAEQSE